MFDYKSADKVVDIAKVAGNKIMDIYKCNEFFIEYKEDNSPVTIADKAANEYILKELYNSFHIPMVSEEKSIDASVRQKWDEYWLIDPLDGTKDFIARNDNFTVNIALIKNNKPIFGVIVAPAINEIYYAYENQGCYMIKDDKVSKLPIFEKEDKYIMAKSMFHDSDDTEKFQQLNNVKKIKKIGSSLKFCLLARGDINIYPRYVGSKEWDIAAGHIIIKESKCNILDLKTLKEPVYNKEDIRNNYFIAYSNDININDLKIGW